MGSCGCGRPSNSLLVSSTDCIALSGNGGSGSPLAASPILDPDPSNQMSCGPSGLIAPCQSDLWADGGVPPGSLPPIVGANFGGNPLLPNGCGPLMAAYGPQADVLLTNTTSCSFVVDGQIIPTQAYFRLDAGASLALGYVVQSTGLNVAPAPIVFPGLFYGGVNENNPAPSGVICGLTADAPAPFTPFLTLAPGDFVWLSIITVLYITGAGPLTSIAPIIGQGPQISFRGLRV